MKRMSACGVNEYDKKGIYQYGKQIMFEEEGLEGIKV